MIYWEHCYLLGSMIFTVVGDVVGDFDEEYEAWGWLEHHGWELVAIAPPDPVRPGIYKYYFKRQRQATHIRTPNTGAYIALPSMERRKQ